MQESRLIDSCLEIREVSYQNKGLLRHEAMWGQGHATLMYITRWQLLLLWINIRLLTWRHVHSGLFTRVRGFNISNMCWLVIYWLWSLYSKQFIAYYHISARCKICMVDLTSNRKHVPISKPVFFWWSPPRGEHIGVNSFAIACTVVEMWTILFTNFQPLKD